MITTLPASIFQVMAEPPVKRRRIDGRADFGPGQEETPSSLKEPISPPRRRNKAAASTLHALPSPIRLTKIKDLPDSSNVDCIGLADILGDPLISECWEFNYLHDIDFLMRHFDEDVRSLVKVHIIHGFWKKEDESRIDLEKQKRLFSNVELHTAYMPEMFGTHHSKMLVLFRHDDTAQVVIHTANMIAKDWTNMANGVWLSPRLPQVSEDGKDGGSIESPVGTGARFKFDLLSYLRAYNTKRRVCESLVQKLACYDFSTIRGALIASTPGKHFIHTAQETRWGWSAMKQALQAVHLQPGKAEIVAQISSIATLGATDVWLRKTLFEALSTGGTAQSKPTFKLIFPTADEIRRSLDGYASGGSIHTKIQSAQQQKQLQYLRPIFCHWANDAEEGIADSSSSAREGDSRLKRAAPHIKTYIRFNGEEKDSIDWALLTSANVSKQAWGEAASSSQELRISSWEVGVLVWPDLIGEGKKTKMVPTFGQDTPAAVEDSEDGASVVGLRMPYSLPLQRYGANEKPWVATASYSEADWMGRVWGQSS